MRKLALDGVALAFEDLGRGAPPILLVHDLGSDHSSFAQQIEHFRHNHRVVAVDLRGHGLSGGQPAQSPADFASDLAQLCYELGVYLPAVIGHGLGGTIAIELASRFPDIPAAVVALDAPIGSLAGTLGAPSPVAAPSRVPVLYVDAGCETVDLRRLRQMCPLLTVSSFEGAGHLIHLEWPEQINALLDSFLARIRKEGI